MGVRTNFAGLRLKTAHASMRYGETGEIDDPSHAGSGNHRNGGREFMQGRRRIHQRHSQLLAHLSHFAALRVP